MLFAFELLTYQKPLSLPPFSRAREKGEGVSIPISSTHDNE